MSVVDRFSAGSDDQRKTVTFGDASAVRSKPFWSLVSLVLLLGFWWVATATFGFPEDFKAMVDENFQTTADEREAENAQRIADGNPNLVVIPERQPLERDYQAACGAAPDSVCDVDEYTQLVNCLLYTSPSPRDATLSRMPSSA